MAAPVLSVMLARRSLLLPAVAVVALVVALAGAALERTPERTRERSGFVVHELGGAQAIWSGGSAKTHVGDTLGQGACWIDLENDGWPDLFVPNGSRRSLVAGAAAAGAEPWRLYRNRGGRLQAVKPPPDFGRPAWGVGCAVGDVDGDGRDDLFVATVGTSDRLLLHRGDLGFEVVELEGESEEVWSSGGLFADLDRDGDLDLVVTTYLDLRREPSPPCLWKGIEVTCGPKGYAQPDDRLYVNDGKGRLLPSDALDGYPGYGLGAVAFDADDDGDADLFVANDSSPNRLFLNQGGLRFVERGLVAGVAMSENGSSQAGMGVDFGDLDGDLRPELVVTNFAGDTHNLFRSEGDGLFSERTRASGLARASFSQLGWGVLLEDFDLDGDLDLFLTNGHVYPQAGGELAQAPQLLFNDGRGGLTEEIERLGPLGELRLQARGAAAADVDRDGDLDVAIVRDGAPPLLLENRLPPDEHRWLRVRLRGAPGNPHALGARVTLDWNGRRQSREQHAARGYLSSSEPVLLFGLGRATRVERLVVRWPDGATTERRGLAVDSTVELECREALP